jgi:hypothetical protein
MGGYVQRRIDRSKMTTNSQYGPNGYDPALADGEVFYEIKFWLLGRKFWNVLQLIYQWQ